MILKDWLIDLMRLHTYKQFHNFQNYDEFRAATGILQRVSLKAINETSCQEYYRVANYSIQVCAGDEKGDNKQWFEQDKIHFLSIFFKIDLYIFLLKGKIPVKEILEVHW